MHPTPRVGVISTGSELVGPGHPLTRGQIPESNSLLLAALVREAGADVVHVTSVPDDESELDDELARCLDARLDLIVLSGGVSVGAHDVVRAVLLPLRTVGFHTIAMQPGKPQAFGMLHRGAETPTPVFGLPGNPVATAVSFEAFVRPALLRLQGAADVHRPRVTAVAAEGWRVPRAKVQFMPVVVVADDAHGSGIDTRPRVRPQPAAARDRTSSAARGRRWLRDRARRGRRGSRGRPRDCHAGT